MTPEAAGHFAKAHEYLTKARALLDVLHYTDEAGRAYLAGYHAAQALIYAVLCSKRHHDAYAMVRHKYHISGGCGID